jgi:hypothetical protein
VPRFLTPRRSLALTLALAAAVYAGDYLYLRLRMVHPKPSDPFESMSRTRVLAIPRKNGGYDYQIDVTQPTERLTCVHSLFPHFGDRPCWYLKPRLNEPVRVGLRVERKAQRSLGSKAGDGATRTRL